MLVMLGMLPALRKTSPRKKPALVKKKRKSTVTVRKRVPARRFLGEDAALHAALEASRRVQRRSVRVGQEIWQWLSKPMGSHFGRCTTHFRTYFSGDVHWGYGIFTHGHMF